MQACIYMRAPDYTAAVKWHFRTIVNLSSNSTFVLPRFAEISIDFLRESVRV